MNIDQLYKELKKEFNIPVAYDHFEKKPTVPFIAYLDIGKEKFVADNKTYVKVTNILIELYTDYKDLALEEKLENFLEEKFRHFDDEATIYIPDEKLYLHSYRIKI